MTIKKWTKPAKRTALPTKRRRGPGRRPAPPVLVREDNGALHLETRAGDYWLFRRDKTHNGARDAYVMTFCGREIATAPTMRALKEHLKGAKGVEF